MLTLDALNALLAISEETIVEELIVALLASPQLAVFFEKFPKLRNVITEDVPRWREALKNHLKETQVPPELTEEVLCYQQSQLLSTSQFIVQLPQILTLLDKLRSPFAAQASAMAKDNPTFTPALQTLFLQRWRLSLVVQTTAFNQQLLEEEREQLLSEVQERMTLSGQLEPILIENENAAGRLWDMSAGQIKRIETLMRNLMPWRKGPFSLYGVNIDTEWRSDWKWDRVLPHLSDLTGRTILDVGCGSGYHMWRMIGAGAHLAVGIDPTQLFLCQFEAVRKLLGNDQRAHLLPLGIEQLPALKAFDTVFSMGVLYHRRSPLEHLWQLKDQLVNEGELVLETLVIDGDENTVLVPGDRYAQMRNVYFIPSALALKNWLKKCGFVDIRIADVSVTTTEEQRRTEWMVTESLADFLDPHDPGKTVEGYPAPKRAVLIARKP